MSHQGQQRWSRFEDIESNVLTAVLLIAIALSLADNVWGFLNKQSWIFPLILAALLVHLRWLDSTRKKVEAIAVGTPLRTYDSHSEYYAHVLRAVTRSERSVYAVFSHATAPHQQTEESRKYYAGTLRWARKLPGRRVLHRVIRVPADSPGLRQWVDEQLDLASRVENYRVRVVNYPPGMRPEGQNIAIIDSSVVFVGFASNDREELKGFSIRDERVARAFEEYFHELWSTAAVPTGNSGNAPTTPGPSTPGTSTP